jgi:hypothetical protein
MTHNRKKFFYFFCSILMVVFSAACSDAVEYQSNECKRQPAFLRQVGFNPSRSAFSTSEKTTMGLVLVELGNQGAGRKYQHPSWNMCGWAGPLLLDQFGNCFVAPVPVISILNNPPALQNRIYKVDAASGVMQLFTELPVADSIPDSNPYGILGFAYLCETNTLYVSTVQGSSRGQEKGVVYALDATTGAMLDQMTGMDVLGMGVSYMPGYRSLYLGSARTSDVYEVELTKKGKFKGKPELAFSLAMQGPRGDDKVRRIRFDQNGNMLVYGVEFNFNLTAPTEKQETVYQYQWNEDSKSWQFAGQRF